jgi:hypothetical protein
MVAEVKPHGTIHVLNRYHVDSDTDGVDLAGVNLCIERDEVFGWFAHFFFLSASHLQV